MRKQLLFINTFIAAAVIFFFIILPFAGKTQTAESLISEGNSWLSSQKYGKALACYHDALILNSNNTTAQNKISQAENKLNDSEIKIALFEENITSGAELLAVKNYKEALLAYKAASYLRPESSYPKNKIKEIGKFYQDPTIEKGYSNATTEGDNALASGNYVKARADYQRALQIKPLDSYSTTQLEKVEEQMSMSDELSQQYDDLIAQADDLKNKGKNREALQAYQQASGIIPTESYPKQQAAEITKTLEQLASVDEKYQATVTEADNLYMAQEYVAAKLKYQEAGKIKTSESYPSSMIARIEEALIKQQSKRQQYDQLIRQGDVESASGNISQAITKYQQALAIFPNEPYPADKIKAIENQKSKEAETLKTFNEALANADMAYSSQQYQDALAYYTEALTIKDNSTYAISQKEKINAILNQQQKDKQSQYDELIQQGDISFEKATYAKALHAFTSAAEIYPEQQYPKEKITIINNLINEVEAQEAEYIKAITKADKYFNNKEYNEALQEYQNAGDIKSQESYPKLQIIEINKILKAQQHIVNQYSDIIAEADKYYAASNFDKAKAKYQQALEVKPEEEYPKTRLTETTDQMGIQEQQRRIEYEKVIETADGFFGMGQYKAALENYKKAKMLLSAETYTDEKIRETEAILREQKTALVAEYQKLVGQADTDFNQKRYAGALVNYEKASKLGTGESYTFQMINKIKEVIAQQVTVDITVTEPVLHEKREMKLVFTPLHYSQKKNNYLIITARNSGEGTPKVFVSFGKGDQKNGGVVMENIISVDPQQYIIPLTNMQRWYREDNNWIKLFMDSGSVEIISIRISNIVD